MYRIACRMSGLSCVLLLFSITINGQTVKLHVSSKAGDRISAKPDAQFSEATGALGATFDIDDSVNGRREFDVATVQEDDLVRLVKHRYRHGIVELQRRRDEYRLLRLSHLDRRSRTAAAYVTERKRDASIGQGEDVVPIAAELLDLGEWPVEHVERDALDRRKVNGEEALHKGVYRSLL